MNVDTLLFGVLICFTLLTGKQKLPVCHTNKMSHYLTGLINCATFVIRLLLGLGGVSVEPCSKKVKSFYKVQISSISY